MTISSDWAKLVAGLALTAAVAGCSKNGAIDRGEVDFENYTAKQIYERGEYDMEGRNYKRSAISTSTPPTRTPPMRSICWR